MNRGVVAAAIGLVAAVWLSLAASERTGARLEAGPAPDARDFGEVPGFRIDAWQLPDDALLGFVEIPAGPFTMGSDPELDPSAFDVERWSADAPQGTVDLPTFHLGRYEVTIAQYAAFVAATGHAVADPQALSGRADHPVASVAWTDALAYARWLQSELAAAPGVAPALERLVADGWRVTLPTEAQWEKGARGDDGRIYPWGDQPRSDRATFQARQTTPVGTYGCPECPYELYDMAGNVWEWTRSPYQPYPYADADDREGLGADALWVMRGGSFGDPAHFVRAANRGGADPGARRPFIGFRLALARP